jgi:hypothetical protein
MDPKEDINHVVANHNKSSFNGLYVHGIDNPKYTLGEGIRYKNKKNIIKHVYWKLPIVM